METLIQDIRYGVRTLAAKPEVAMLAVIALALGIGASGNLQRGQHRSRRVNYRTLRALGFLIGD